jgi:hypothetical protein
VPLWEPAVSIAESQESRNWESCGPMHCSIENLETPMSGKTAVTRIMVIWARGLARRASA